MGAVEAAVAAAAAGTNIIPVLCFGLSPADEQRGRMMPVDTGFRPGFNRFFYRMDFGVDRSALIIPQLLQTFLADPEEMGHLVDDGNLDLTLQLFKSFAHLLQGLLEDEDRIRMKRGRGEERVLLERRSLV